MTSTYMAEFDTDSVEFRVLAESNSVMYHLEVFASNSNAVNKKGAVYINGALVATPTSGINVYQMIYPGNAITEVKNFTFTSTDSSGNIAFTQYLNSQTEGAFLIVSDTSMISSPIIDTWFTTMYSKSWPGATFLSKYPTSSYCAIWDADSKKIVKECFFANDGIKIEDSRAYVAAVYDDLFDIGSTGYVWRTVEDYTEYTYTSYQQCIYPNQTGVEPLTNSGISPGNTMLMVCDLYTSTDLNAQGSNTRASLNWLNSDGEVISSTQVDCLVLDNWTRFEKYLTIPSNAVTFSILVYPYPELSTAISGITWGCRNMVLSQTSIGNKTNVIAEFGINGIRNYSINENGSSYLMEIPDGQSNLTEVVPFMNIKELPRGAATNLLTSYYDTDGNFINCHAGGMLFYEDYWYWYGEWRVPRPSTGHWDSNQKVSMYKSKDKNNWEFVGFVLDITSDPMNWDAERPKIIYNAKNDNWVMWMHMEPNRQYIGGYAGYAVSNNLTGPFTFMGYSNPNANILPVGYEVPDNSWQATLGTRAYTRDFTKGQMVRDCTLFVDEDDKAYLIHASEDNYSMHADQLNDDYTGFNGVWGRILIGKQCEAPAVFKKDGVYYMFCSGLSGYAPNPLRLASATNILGPWTLLSTPLLANGVPVTQNLYDGQPANTYYDTQLSRYVLMQDQWNQSDQSKSLYVWLEVSWVNDSPKIII